MSPENYEVWSVATEIASKRGFYLAGGTGLALFLHHRQSRDLDFFLHLEFDQQEILNAFNAQELPIVLLDLSPGTLNILCDSVKVQFLYVKEQKLLCPTCQIGTADVASIPDILAMKLNAVTGRAKLRNYFDLMVIDQQTGYSIEQGLSFFLDRYKSKVPNQSVTTMIRSLGYLDDEADDETVPVGRQVAVDYWSYAA